MVPGQVIHFHYRLCYRDMYKDRQKRQVQHTVLGRTRIRNKWKYMSCLVTWGNLVNFLGKLWYNHWQFPEREKDPLREGEKETETDWEKAGTHFHITPGFRFDSIRVAVCVGGCVTDLRSIYLDSQANSLRTGKQRRRTKGISKQKNLIGKFARSVCSNNSARAPSSDR